MSARKQGFGKIHQEAGQIRCSEQKQDFVPLKMHGMKMEMARLSEVQQTGRNLMMQDRVAFTGLPPEQAVSKEKQALYYMKTVTVTCTAIFMPNRANNHFFYFGNEIQGLQGYFWRNLKRQKGASDRMQPSEAPP